MNTLMRFAFVLLISVFCIGVRAQEPEYKKYNWEPVAALHPISPNDKEFPSIVLKENHIVEFALDSDQLVCYTILHKIIKANNDDGVVQNNRIFLPFSVNTKMLVTKARVINSKGEIKELKEKDIKEGVNNETKTTYRYFALDGLDVGSEIEFILIFQQDAEYYGRMYQLQDQLNKRNVEFSIYSPSNLIFITKSYNKFPEFISSVTPDGRNRLYAKLDSIRGVKPEQFAVYDPNMMQFALKLNENKTQGRTNIINFLNASSTIGEMAHEKPSKKAAKEIEKIVKSLNIDNSNVESSIRVIENYIKKNFVVEEHVPDNYKTLDAVLEYKNTDAIGITKLYTAIFDNLKIDCQIVLTTDRYETRFDPKFESYSFLDKYLLYFPSIDKYLSPEAIGFRLGMIPYNFFYNYGLFVKTVHIGDFTNYIGEVKFIEPTPYDATKYYHKVNVDFTASMENPVFTYELRLEGYYAQQIQPYYSFVTPDQNKEIDDDVLKNFLTGVTVSNYSIENKGIENFVVKPFIIKATSNTNTIVDKAGNKFLFKIGLLIGPQVEMYQDEERKFDVENDFNRSYYRELSFTLPDGYKVNNLDALKMKVELLEKGTPTCYFISDYEMVDGKTVVVKVHEDYKSIYYPKDRFQEYRKVINAAADFNKIVLVLEKK
jgi:hypothetical protein